MDKFRNKTEDKKRSRISPVGLILAFVGLLICIVAIVPTKAQVPRRVDSLQSYRPTAPPPEPQKEILKVQQQQLQEQVQKFYKEVEAFLGRPITLPPGAEVTPWSAKKDEEKGVSDLDHRLHMLETRVKELQKAITDLRTAIGQTRGRVPNSAHDQRNPR